MISRSVEEQHLTERSDIDFFETQYQHLLAVYATVQGLKSDVGDLKTNIKRLCSHRRRKDLMDFTQEV